MPKYDYRCSVCSVSIEFERKFNEDREPLCCDKTMNRQWGSFGIQFKGNGFYSTDSNK
jgi:putative FmdB family regulatory protein